MKIQQTPYNAYDHIYFYSSNTKNRCYTVCTVHTVQLTVGFQSEYVMV